MYKLFIKFNAFSHLISSLLFGTLNCSDKKYVLQFCTLVFFFFFSLRFFFLFIFFLTTKYQTTFCHQLITSELWSAYGKNELKKVYIFNCDATFRFLVYLYFLGWWTNKNTRHIWIYHKLLWNFSPINGEEMRR